MRIEYSWLDHFDNYNQFQAKVNWICEALNKLADIFHGDRDDRPTLAFALQRYGPNVAELAYQITHDAVRNHQQGYRDKPVNDIGKYFTNALPRALFLRICPDGEIIPVKGDPLAWHIRFKTGGQFYRYTGKLSDAVDAALGIS